MLILVFIRHHCILIELKRDLSKTYIVFAGLEPKSFKALFPFWEDREDVKEINMLVSNQNDS